MTRHGQRRAQLVGDQSWVYFDGEFRRYGDARVGAMTHALHYGTNCFEGIRAYWDGEAEQLNVVKLGEHYERMAANAAVLFMLLPHPVEGLCEITVELLRRNEWREDVYVRPLCYKAGEDRIGVNLVGVDDGFLIVTTPYPAYLDVERGARCMTSTWRRLDDAAVPVRAKIGGLYVNNALAKTEAVMAGFDEAIMLTPDGHVCEGSTENIFLVRDGILVTPPPSDNILEGITRRAMTVLADELGVAVVERSVDRTELFVADEILLCGSGAQVAAVVEIDRRPVGDGTPGPVTRQLQSRYFDICQGRDDKHRDWLTPVY